MHALPGLCTLNIFEYEISLSCGKFRNHHRELLFGHSNTFNRGRPVMEITLVKSLYSGGPDVIERSRFAIKVKQGSLDRKVYIKVVNTLGHRLGEPCGVPNSKQCKLFE